MNEEAECGVRSARPGFSFFWNFVLRGSLRGIGTRLPAGHRHRGSRIANSSGLRSGTPLPFPLQNPTTSPMSNASIEHRPGVFALDSGDAVDEFVITNAGGSSVSLLNYGATLTRLRVPDRIGRVGDVVLGYDDAKRYEPQTHYLGCTVGRYANRIAGGRFAVDGKTYQVPVNDGPNSLHGGLRGFDKRVWRATPSGSNTVTFRLTDPAGAEGYPGAVEVRVEYSLGDSNVLRIEYEATATEPTPINLTNHAYFNLKDAGRSTILDHEMQIDADEYLPVSDVQIPLGRPSLVAGTAFDFTKPARVGGRIDETPGTPNGYDHCYCLRKVDAACGTPTRAATVFEPTTGRVMEAWTTEPAMQFYSGNFLDGTLVGRGQTPFYFRNGFCLEAQHYPDSPNRPTFPNTILRPGQTYRQVTEYRFSVR
jgi:aldose 1-epimerase